MEQVKDYSDSRLYAGCVYCGMQVTTRDHVPSKAFLDAPYPENLPVVGACKDCNEGFSKDEQYVACLIEVARRGSSEPLEMRRLTVAATLQRSPNLKALIDSGRSELNGSVQYGFDSNRLERVLVKLAKGHACYELAVWNLGAPSSVWWAPLVALSELERDQFDEPVLVNTIGEVGSRSVSRMIVIQPKLSDESAVLPPLLISDWLDVQEERYRFLAIDDGREVRVSIVIGEYLCARVIWDRSADAVFQWTEMK